MYLSKILLVHKCKLTFMKLSFAFNENIIAHNTISFLICTLRSVFEGARKVVLQTRIIFLVGDSKKKGWFIPKPHIFHFSATLQITSDGTDQKTKWVKSLSEEALNIYAQINNKKKSHEFSTNFPFANSWPQPWISSFS